MQATLKLLDKARDRRNTLKKETEKQKMGKNLTATIFVLRLFIHAEL